MRFTLAAPVDEPLRPKGLGVTALLLGALALAPLISRAFELSGGALGGYSSTANLVQLFSSGVLLAAELFVVWSYWKGKNLARIFILIASFLIVAREVSEMIESGGSPVELMNHPVGFLEFVLASFLLYWLNTQPVRAWFRNAPPTAADLIDAHLAGKLCTAVGNGPGAPNQGWSLSFEHDAKLTLNCPWRVVLDDNLAFASSFSGNPTAFDEEQPRQLLQNLRVKAVRVTPRTSDLFIAFEMGLELQTWSTDPQAQQWKFSDPVLTVIADSVGLNSQAIAEPIATEDPAAND